eukprot:36820-Heterocapsa_arctica.AAC.1
MLGSRSCSEAWTSGSARASETGKKPLDADRTRASHTEMQESQRFRSNSTSAHDHAEPARRSTRQSSK